jgi:hypothetical protein
MHLLFHFLDEVVVHRDRYPIKINNILKSFLSEFYTYIALDF